MQETWIHKEDNSQYRSLSREPWSQVKILIYRLWHIGSIDQFQYIKIQSQTIDLRTRLWGINHTNSVFIPQSLVHNYEEAAKRI